MKTGKENLIVISIFLLLTIVLYFPIFKDKLAPFPGDFQVAWFEPWKSQFAKEQVLTIAHKPIADDIFRQIYPFKILAVEQLKKGILPLWNPYNGSGMPLFATMHVGYLNPFNIVFFIFNHITAWTIYIVLQPFLIASLLYLYTRQIKLSIASSLFSSISFALSSFVITRTIYGDYDYAVIGLLIGLYSIETYLQTQGKKILLLPLGVFLIISSTQPQIIGYCALFIVAYSYIRLMDKLHKWRSFYYILFLIFLGLGLSAIQIIPTLELYKYSAISNVSSKFIIERFLLPVSHFITFIIPNYFGNQSTYNYWGAADYIETVGAVGSIPVLFGLLSFIKRGRSNLQYFLFGTVLFSILFSLDSPVTRYLFSLPIPILSTSIPSRIFFLSSLSISILAGIGMENWIKKENIFKYAVGYLVLIIFLVLITFILYMQNVPCMNQYINNCRFTAVRNTFLEFGVLLLGYLVILYTLKTQVIKNRLIPSVFIIIIVTVINLYNGYKFLPFTSADRVMPSNDLINFLSHKTSDSRIIGMGSAAIKTDFASYYKFHDPNYYDPLYIKTYGELISYANTGKPDSIRRSDVEINNEIKNDFKKNRLLDILGVKYTVFKKNEIPKDYLNDNIVYQNSNFAVKENTVATRIYITDKVQFLKKETILDTLFSKNYDPKTEAIVDEHLQQDIYPQNTLSTKISILEEKSNSLEVSTNSNKLAFLILTDNYYPGWHAYIDKKETKIYRTNYAFRGIIIPEGNHQISFIYNPLSFKLGAYVSVISGFIYLLLVFRKKVSRQKNDRQKSQMTIIKVSRGIPKNKQK